MVARQPNTKKIRSYESSEFWLHSFGVVFPSKICHRPTNQSVALLRLVKFDESQVLEKSHFRGIYLHRTDNHSTLQFSSV